MPVNLPTLPPRNHDSHKGDFGRALVIGGSAGMAGAIALAGKATLRSGAGLVTVAVPESILPTVAGFEPSYMTAPLPENQGQLTGDAIPRLLELVATASCFAVGPGLGRGGARTRLVSQLYRRATINGVLDADALFGLAESPRGLTQPAAKRVITPHLGEFRRIVGQPDLDRPAAVDMAKSLAAQHDIVIVLKGAGTLITDGKRHASNETGNPGMATGGTGDVLTGMICGLLAQGMEPFDAATAAVHIHGAAGDAAAEQLGQVSLIASDLLTFLPTALQRYMATS